MIMQSVHTSVLLQEAVDALKVFKGGRYVDATLGGAGHTQEIIKQGGVVLGLDQDRIALERVSKIGVGSKSLKTVRGNFSDIKKIAQENGFEKVEGILFDLGLSSDQLESSGRGFSFSKNEPLDMRMGEEGVTAEEIVNTFPENELAEIFAKYGEELKAQEIAARITARRKQKPIRSTFELVDTIGGKQVLGSIHPATKVFMALRIAVNDELRVLRKAIRESEKLLKNNGRIAAITFHSLEDRIVKREFIDMQREGLGKVITKKPVYPTALETRKNRRARSAKLRIFEKYEKN